MSQQLNSEVEKAKLAANYWNGIAIATVVIGALPFVIDVSSTPSFEEVDWLALGFKASTAFLAVGMSRFFHTLAVRAIYKA